MTAQRQPDSISASAFASTRLAFVILAIGGGHSGRPCNPGTGMLGPGWFAPTYASALLMKSGVVLALWPMGLCRVTQMAMACDDVPVPEPTKAVPCP